MHFSLQLVKVCVESLNNILFLFQHQHLLSLFLFFFLRSKIESTPGTNLDSSGSHKDLPLGFIRTKIGPFRIKRAQCLYHDRSHVA